MSDSDDPIEKYKVRFKSGGQLTTILYPGQKSLPDEVNIRLENFTNLERNIRQLLLSLDVATLRQARMTIENAESQARFKVNLPTETSEMLECAAVIREASAKGVYAKAGSLLADIIESDVKEGVSLNNIYLSKDTANFYFHVDKGSDFSLKAHLNIRALLAESDTKLHPELASETKDFITKFPGNHADKKITTGDWIKANGSSINNAYDMYLDAPGWEFYKVRLSPDNNTDTFRILIADNGEETRIVVEPRNGMATHRKVTAQSLHLACEKVAEVMGNAGMTVSTRDCEAFKADILSNTLPAESYQSHAFNVLHLPGVRLDQALAALSKEKILNISPVVQAGITFTNSREEQVGMVRAAG